MTKVLQRYENNVQQTLKRDMERYGVSLRIQSECGKIRTRITSNTDAFYAVIRVWFLVLNSVTLIWEDLDAENGPKVEQTFDETFYRQNILTDKPVVCVCVFGWVCGGWRSLDTQLQVMLWCVAVRTTKLRWHVCLQLFLCLPDSIMKQVFYQPRR